jgi:hypothetical protein
MNLPQDYHAFRKKTTDPIATPITKIIAIVRANGTETEANVGEAKMETIARIYFDPTSAGRAMSCPIEVENQAIGKIAMV